MRVRAVSKGGMAIVTFLQLLSPTEAFPQCTHTTRLLVSSGSYHTCARNWSADTGEISCWGWNEFGQSEPAPLSFTSAGVKLTAVQVDSGPRHSCAIATAQPVSVCRGGPDDGWLCDTTRACESGICTTTPVRAQETAQQVSEANVFCWGSDAHGQAPANLAVRLSPNLIRTACCSSADAAGVDTCQCGAGVSWQQTQNARNQSGAASDVVQHGRWELRKEPLQVCAGGMHSCVLWADGSVSCFGCIGCKHNQTEVPAEFASVAVASAAAAAASAPRATPASSSKAPKVSATAISCGLRHTCVLLSADQRVVCWGDDEHGQASPPPLLAALQVSSGAVHTCALAINTSLVCWGSNAHRQASPPPGSGFVMVSAGLSFSCGLRSTKVAGGGSVEPGRVECFGHHFSSSSSSPPAADQDTSVSAPGLVPTGASQVGKVTAGTRASAPAVPETLSARDLSSISVGHSHVCVTDAADALVHCYHVPQPPGVPDSSRTGASEVPSCVNPCSLCKPTQTSGAAANRRGALAGVTLVASPVARLVFTSLLVRALLGH